VDEGITETGLSFKSKSNSQKTRAREKKMQWNSKEGTSEQASGKVKET
jgi:hypothetical protein